MKPSAAVSLLLTNLRLLDYDSDSPDSFPITPDVFTSLTNKGKAFEHIIHHLFRSFDPDECELRLQGCWPVYEPAQSRDLRNIVFKWLEDLKAGGRLNGVLIRRTALDDCCGQRYEELLLALSTMVLKEKIEGGAFQDVRNTFAYNQATSLEPSKAHLTTLNIAHRYSLTSLLKSRERSKAQWSSFSSLLDEKEVEIAAISKVLSEAEPEEPPKATRRGYEEAIRAKWRNNWLGDPKWLEIILNGDPDAGRDHLMEWPFERAIEKHHYFKNGQSMPSIPGVASLKELDKKVELQQQRVAEMRKLREMAGFSSTRPNTKSPSKSDGVERVEKKGLKLEFKLHQKLNLKEAATTVPRKERGRENEYRELLDQLQEELIQAGAPQNRAREAPTTGQYYSYRQDVDMAEDSHMLDQSSQVYHLNINMVEPMSNRESNEDVSMLDGDVSMLDADMSYQDGTKDDGLLHEAYSTRSPSLQLRLSPSPSPSPNRSPIPTKMISRQIDEYEPDSIPTSGSSGASMLGGSDEEMSEMEPTPPFLSRMSTPGGKPRLAPPVDFGDYATPERPNSHARKSAVGLGVAFGDDEMLAEQIISNIASASFSPEKASPAKQPPPHPSHSPHLPDSPPAISYSPSSFRIDASFDESMTLPPQRSDGSSAGLRTPAPEESIITTPKEELLMSEDYTSVFKSRPKIALSPTFTPTDGSATTTRVIPGIDLSDSDDAMDDDEEMEYISSPTARKMRHV